MIRHIVIFNLKPEIEASDRERLFAQMRELVKISSVRRLAAGKILEPREEWYRPRMSSEFGYALTMEFDDEDGLYTYQTDPLHITLAAELRKQASAVKVMDFVTI